MEEKKNILKPILRLSPVPNCNIVKPTVNLSEFLTTQSICLNAYEERMGVKTPAEKIYHNLFSSFRTSSKGMYKGEFYVLNSNYTEVLLEKLNFEHLITEKYIYSPYEVLQMPSSVITFCYTKLYTFVVSIGPSLLDHCKVLCKTYQ